MLLEAGPADQNQAIHIPAAFSRLFKSALDWDYQTAEQEHLAGRSIYWPRGKVLGGSSSLNAMMWVRGFAADYDHWAERAGDDWSFESLLPYFRKVEAVAGSSDPDHGTEGALSIQRQRSPRSHTAVFLEATRELGYPTIPANSRTPMGFSQTMVTQKNGARSSTATAYLKPARHRANLEVRTGAHVTRVLLDGTLAVGVEAVIGGATRTLRARREVILSGGAVNTPQLLLLSGIGPGPQLRELGIDVVVDSPEVGKNLRDHLLALLGMGAERDTLFAATRPRELASYLLRRRGMLTSNVAEAYGFISTTGAALPDIEIIYAPALYVDEGLTSIPAQGVGLGSILLQPKSHGTVTLASNDPLAKPIIDPRYLSDPNGDDLRTIMAGLDFCEDVLQTAAMRADTDGHFYAPEGADQMDRVTRDLASVTQLSHTLYHPTSSVRMGSDASAPVDPELRVRGLHGLRVADASVMPSIIRGHTNAPAIVIGEKAADLIRKG
jgi:choline dehydrogenase